MHKILKATEPFWKELIKSAAIVATEGFAYSVGRGIGDWVADKIREDEEEESDD